jgi:hypothetical protein
MRLAFRPVGCYLLILPLAAWNLVLASRLTDPRLTSDAHSPTWLLAAEGLGRVLVFALPLWMPLQLRHPSKKAGLALYLAGTLVYFASWLPLMLAPASAWSSSFVGLLAPRLTPLLPFLGIALIGGAWPYAVLSTAFVLLHTWHGVLNLAA